MKRGFVFRITFTGCPFTSCPVHDWYRVVVLVLTEVIWEIGTDSFVGAGWDELELVLLVEVAE